MRPFVFGSILQPPTPRRPAIDIQLRHPDDSDRLNQLIASEPRAKQRDRLRAVRLALDGLTCPQIQKMLGRSKQFVQRWSYAYRDRGLEAVAPKKQTGRPTALPKEQYQAFKQRILQGPTEADGVCSLRGEDARRILAQEFDAHYRSLSGVYALLHRLGLSCLKPRPQHRKNDPEAMKAWREQAPVFLNKSAASTPRRPSRSGSKTRPGSASKAP